MDTRSEIRLKDWDANTPLTQEAKMRKQLIHFLVAAVLLVPFGYAAQASSAQVTEADMAPFLGKWTGQHEEGTSGGSSESRPVELTISNSGGRPMVAYKLGPSGAGFGKHSASSSGSRTSNYPGMFKKRDGVTTFSFTTSSGTKIVFTLENGKLIGNGTGGRFTIRYFLSKAGS
jgi:hypothetical protein